LPPLSSATVAIVTTGVIVATIVDLRTRRIPNVLTGGMALLGLGLAATGMTGITLGASTAGLALGIALMLPGHLLGATGAGDVKLMGAVGAVVGPALVLKAFLLTAVAGGALAAVVALRRRRLGRTLAGTGRLIARAPGAGERIRSTTASRFAYGPAIAVGSILAMLLA
jgi:prepilin peptidase CpaA